jgi:hypothetical protein
MYFQIKKIKKKGIIIPFFMWHDLIYINTKFVVRGLLIHRKQIKERKNMTN